MKKISKIGSVQSCFLWAKVLICYMSNQSIAQHNLINVCPALTADLTSLTVTNAPQGISVSFHTGSIASDANLVSIPTTVGAGTYYAAFYDNINKFYSDNTTEIVVLIESCEPTCDDENIHTKQAKSKQASHCFLIK